MYDQAGQTRDACTAMLAMWLRCLGQAYSPREKQSIYTASMMLDLHSERREEHI